MDEAVLALLGTLVEVRAELGQAVYESAVERARVAVAHECLVEAERRAILAGRRPRSDEPGCVVLRFPDAAARD
ncbi:hypothetical protein [Methylobacterium sp. J-076]|uniref:hypothetical protein n=1 Tax=Methylobacterium sp. J-076 TaxID=2836655 RepID=UPI001FB91581|nr:hypothetical protein [Methylobacterium sp. J-076]MCJ2014198.1 hypothetical protein [Methylobacterium sp. J-076]